MADRLGLVARRDRHLPRSRRPRSIGTTLWLAAIHRAVWPCSKRGWATWAQRPALPHLFTLRPAALTSQYVWDQMDAVGESALEAIEADLTRKGIQALHLPLATLFYDTTNVCTSIASGNERSALAQRGHSKQKRTDLRQCSLALLVARDGQIPLYAHVYDGHVVDAQPCPDSLPASRQRGERIVGHIDASPRVYDKGNNAQTHQALVDAGPGHSVASLVPTHYPDRMAIPTRMSTSLGPGPFAGRPVYRCQRTLWGAERTLVLFIRTPRRIGQRRSLQQPLTTRVAALPQWQQTLAKPGSGPRTATGARQRVATWGAGHYLNQVLKITYHARRKGARRVSWEIDSAALAFLETAVCGKRRLMTDQHAWSTEEIMAASQGQSHAEAAFRQLNDVDHLTVRPPYHWTDQKGRVHTLVCLLAFLLCRLVERESRAAGDAGNLSHLLDLLGTIRLAMIVQPSGTQGGRPCCAWVLEESEPEAWRLSHRLVPHRPPFVSTSHASQSP